MKTKTALSVILFILTNFVLQASAQNHAIKETKTLQKQQAHICTLADNQVKVSYANTYQVKKPKVQIQILSKSGEVLYSEMHKKKNLELHLDISNFPDGDYTFKILNQNGLVCSRVISKRKHAQNNNSLINYVESNYLSFNNSNHTRFNIEDDIVYFHFKDPMGKKKRAMEMRITEETANLLYIDKFYANGKIDINFDLSTFPQGKYTFQFYNRNHLVCSRLVKK